MVGTLSKFCCMSRRGTVCRYGTEKDFHGDKLSPLINSEISFRVLSNARNIIGSIGRHGGILREPGITGVSGLFVISSFRAPIPGAFVVSGLATVTMCGGVRPMVIFGGYSVKDFSSLLRVCRGSNFGTFIMSTRANGKVSHLGSRLQSYTDTFANGSNINGSDVLGHLLNSDVVGAKRMDRRLKHNQRAAHRVRTCRLSFNNCIFSAPNFSTLSIRRFSCDFGRTLPRLFPSFGSCVCSYGFSDYARAGRSKYTIVSTMGGNRVRTAHRSSCLRLFGRLGSLGT